MSNIFSLFPSRKNTFEALIQPRLHELYCQAYRLTKNQDDAEDLVQDMVLHLYKKNTALDKINDLRPWLYKVLYHHFLNNKRSQSRQPFGHLDENSDAIIEQFEGHSETPQALTEQASELEQLQYMLNLLPNHHKELLIMHDAEGFTLNEISNILDVPLGTLKSRLHRARNSLRNSMMREPSMQNRCVTE